MTGRAFARICAYVAGTLLLILGTVTMFNNYRRSGDSSSWPIVVISIGVTLIMMPQLMKQRDQANAPDEDAPDRPDLDR